MNRLLVVEDEDVIRKALLRLLERNNYDVTGVASVAEAIDASLQSFDLILADLRLPGEEGTALIEHTQTVPVLIMTSHASVRSAVESMRLGAIDYISKPFDHDELLLVIERSLRHNRLSAQNNAMKQDLLRLFPHDEIFTQSDDLQHIIEELTQLPPTERFVYLHGERGCGKELLARMVHDHSDRASAPLVIGDLPMFDPATLEAVLLGSDSDQQPNPAVPRMGLVQSAHNGTLMLRNLTLLPQSTQVKLQSLLQQHKLAHAGRHSQQRPVDIRVIALESEAPDDNIKKGLLLPELADLLTTRTYAVPALRQRREDIESLVHHYLGIYLRRHRTHSIRVSDRAMHALKAYDWPGNITELKNALERAALSCNGDEITPEQLGIGVLDQDGGNNDLSLDGYFRYFVLSHQHTMSETDLAQRLGISRTALWERRQRMDLPRP
ncbi:MAG: sigma-54 dependent transcriptional regulator [Gammaproteobacteria bacterium]|nr:sigma-54 dependent transcriptional regulator [Gammaproteobacteria bacterium]